MDKAKLLLQSARVDHRIHLHLHLWGIYADAYTDRDGDSHSYIYFDIETFTDGETSVNTSHADAAPESVITGISRQTPEWPGSPTPATVCRDLQSLSPYR